MPTLQRVCEGLDPVLCLSEVPPSETWTCVLSYRRASCFFYTALQTFVKAVWFSFTRRAYGADIRQVPWYRQVVQLLRQQGWNKETQLVPGADRSSTQICVSGHMLQQCTLPPGNTLITPLFVWNTHIKPQRCSITAESGTFFSMLSPVRASISPCYVSMLIWWKKESKASFSSLISDMSWHKASSPIQISDRFKKILSNPLIRIPNCQMLNFFWKSRGLVAYSLFGC